MNKLLFFNKITLFHMILLQFRTILFPYKLYVTDKKTYLNRVYNLEISYLITVLLSIPFHKLPWVCEKSHSGHLNLVSSEIVLQT
jgi:hypothetical protein